MADQSAASDDDKEKERRRAARIAAQEASERQASRRRVQLIGGGVLVAAAIVVVLVIVLGGGGKSGGPTAPSPSSGPFGLGTTQNEAAGATVDGVQCQQSEQVRYHIHSHLAVFVNGRPGTIPEGIGIAPPRTTQKSGTGLFVAGGSCFYWLHSHTDDGVIHVESPSQRIYTLGNYFDIWNQPLSRARVGAASGPVTAYVNGRPFTGDPRSISLGLHSVIQLDVATKVAPAAYTFANGL
ncbi:MAG: hypothetical protein ACR2KV_01250 [Solirubrobacteraceae bacterium]